MFAQESGGLTIPALSSELASPSTSNADPIDHTSETIGGDEQ